MHITQSNLAFSSQHRLENETVRQTVLEAEPGSSSPASFHALFIDKLRPLAGSATETTAEPRSASPAAAFDAALQSLIQALFGRGKIPDDSTTAADTAALAVDRAPPAQLRRLPQLELVHTREEESCSFAASGNICLADGSQRQFDVSYALERSEETTQLSFGPAFKDPLVLDLGAPASRLGAHEVAFDLDSDGQTELMRMPEASSGLLFLDRNQNDMADDGSELFGPQSGNGFADLAKLDEDGNGWIDSADTAYADMKLWQMSSDGAEQVQSLAAAGIGALATGYADTPFSLKERGQIVGQMRSSSVWLGETSGAGSVRQIDIATTPSETSSA